METRSYKYHISLSHGNLFLQISHFICAIMKRDQSLQLLEEVNESCNNNNQDGKKWINVASIQANKRHAVGLFLGKALDESFAF